ncbi:sugar transporter ERD6-like 6 isoform X3 [Spinacia oleracea]|nr:sugar transporter ERD6-like 6 isoform X3 [Spinacia oleracea]XP_056690744.1 sugar transporter ERD6-like 6 isoform X3 [Spinacia oleracea]XP_056697156.1 sugar transporter ERD6-like 6 isoform X3 [Spinacia oleracea]
MVGAIASGQISKYIGRKGSLMIASIPNIIGWLVVSFSRRCKVIMRQQILLLKLSLQAHCGTSNSRNKKVAQLVRNMNLMRTEKLKLEKGKQTR